MKEKYIPGEGCECSARCSCECGCDVDWTPREVYDLREQRDKALCELEMWKDGNIMHELHMNEIQGLEQQRDRLAEALRELCETLLNDKPRDITESLYKAGDALAAWKEARND